MIGGILLSNHGLPNGPSNQNFPMRIFVILLLLFIPFVLCKLGSLSLLHASGTTFLNLQRASRKQMLQYYFKNDAHISGVESEFSKILGVTPNVTTPGTFVFENTILGTVTLSEGNFRTGFFKSPNGDRKYQGWIQSETDYYTRDQEVGDEKILKKLLQVLDNLPTTELGIILGVQVPRNNATLLRDLMVNYWHPENRKDVINESHFISEQAYSNGFMDKLLASENGVLLYNPTMDELFDDFVVRQLGELHGVDKDKVWTEPLHELMHHLEGIDFVYPSFGLDILPVLMAYRPDHMITEKLLKHRDMSETVQFREFKGEIDIAIRRAAGFVKVTELYGPIISDSVLSQVSYVEKHLIQQIRIKLLSEEPVFIKYLTWDPETCSHVQNPKTKNIEKEYEKDRILLGFIATNYHGLSPLVIPGTSVCWHQTSEHRFNILCQHNPALINHNVIQFLGNKYLEHLFFETYCGGLLPKTVRLVDLLPPGTSPFNLPIHTFLSAADKAYPRGWVAKHVWEYNTVTDIIHWQLDFPKMLQKLNESTFADYVEKMKSYNFGCEPVEDLNAILRTSPHFKAWRLFEMLKDVRDVMIQIWLIPKREFRVECYGGVCPMDHISTWEDKDSKNDTSADTKYFKGIANLAVKQCLDKLPEKLKGIPMSADVALLSDLATPLVYETNPGGYGNFLFSDDDILHKHNRFMLEYPELASSERRISTGFSAEAQMEFIKRLVRFWNLDIATIEHRFTYLSDRIIDPSMCKIKEVNRSFLNSTGAQVYAYERPSVGKRYIAIRKAMQTVSSYKITNTNSTSILKFLYRTAMMKESLNNNALRNVLVKKFLEFAPDHIAGFREELNKVHTKKGNLAAAKFAVGFYDVINAYQVMNYDVSGLKVDLGYIFNKYTSVDFPKIFPELSHEKFVGILKKVTKDKKDLLKLDHFLIDFAESLLQIRGLYRVGLRIKGITLSRIVREWIPRLRALYKEETFFMSILHSVLSMVSLLTDQSLFYLDKRDYIHEYQFLTEAVLNPKIQTNALLLGRVIDSLLVFKNADDSQVQMMIDTARITLLKMQTKGSLWKMESRESLTATAYAISGLIEHAFLTDVKRKFGSVVSTKKYIERMNRMGLMMTDYLPSDPKDWHKDEL
jgi:hypothetical protein